MGTGYAEGRKPHKRVDQSEYLRVLGEVGVARCDDIAEHFDVSPATAKRQLDGLAHQGKVRIAGGASHGAEYELVTRTTPKITRVSHAEVMAVKRSSHLRR